MKKNVLIIKEADFSAMKVETIPLVDSYDYGLDDYLYKDKTLQVSSSTTFTSQSTYYGGFINVSDFRGCSATIQNDTGTTYYAAIKNVSSFVAGGTFDFATGFSSAESLSSGQQIDITIPADADYLYCMIHYNNGFKNVEVEIIKEI